MNWDVVVVGAGAAGLLAATRAAERGRRTLLLEKNRKPGVKILMSGGARCNLTHDVDTRGIVEAYGASGPFLYPALAALGPRDLVKLVEDEGVRTKVEPGGKIFPVSNRATDILDALMRRFRRGGASMSLEEFLTDLSRDETGFRLTTNRSTLHAPAIIITTGGRSYPGSGTTGDGYPWAAKFGHTLVPPRPALVPITTRPAWVPSLRGITVPDVHVRVVDAQGHSLDRRRGSFLFTHFGVSGPVVLDVSRTVTGHPHPNTLSLECDFLPETSAEELRDLLQRGAAASGRTTLGSMLSDVLPARLREAFLEQAGLDPNTKAAELSRSGRERWIDVIKHVKIPVSGTLGFDRAEVTAGGVSLAEIDSKTMRSKLVPNLYFAGEILDLDGPIGGYNFQAAFSTGWLAGESI